MLTAALALALSIITIADASTAVTQTSNGFRYTAADAQAAINGYRRVFTDHSFTMYTEMTPAATMPAWDPVAHYVGPKRMPDGQTAYVLLLNDRYRAAMDDLKGADPGIAAQIASATLMVAIDGGLAGPKWKAMYADAAREDLALPVSVQDRYQNRHALVAPLAHDRSLYVASQPPAGVIGLTGAVLTAPIPYAAGLVGYAQAGIGAARITELCDDPRALAEPQSQQFIDGWFAHLEAMLPSEDAKAFLKQQRGLLVVDASFDQVRNSQAFTQAMQTVANRFAPAQMNAFLLGLDAEQSTYNATLSKQTNIDALFRSSIARDAVLDSALPKLATMRNDLGDLSPGDWQDIAKQAAAIVNYILSVH